MNIVFFAHPAFLGQQSMGRFSNMLVRGMRERGHEVSLWSPTPHFFNLGKNQKIKKWLGYIDQFIVFPWIVKQRIKRCSSDTLFVFTDQALGPWVPLVAHRPHVIHCHDFLAQRSALGEIPENKTGWSGQMYQALIRRGYRRGRTFIPTSYRTKQDLHRFLKNEPEISLMIYNCLNQGFHPIGQLEARTTFEAKIGIDVRKGYLLHIGNNSWYKNRRGVIELYEAWRELKMGNLPLLLIGKSPTAELRQLRETSPFRSDIHFLVEVDDECVRLAYAGASLFLFPSLAEGFGWPVAEAMASGCLVLTTDEAPMTEVAGKAGFYIPRRPYESHLALEWARMGAQVIDRILNLKEEERKTIISDGLQNVRRFDPFVALNCIEAVYFHLV